MYLYLFVKVGRTMADCVSGHHSLLEEIEALYQFQFAVGSPLQPAAKDVLEFTIKTLNKFNQDLERIKYNCDKR
jgi:hypothetical protein